MTLRPLTAGLFAAGLALAAPAPADGQKDAFQQLYDAAKTRPAGTSATKAGAVARFGRYESTNMSVAHSPVQSIMRVRRLPDGREIVECSIESVHQHEAGGENGPVRREK